MKPLVDEEENENTPDEITVFTLSVPVDQSNSDESQTVYDEDESQSVDDVDESQSVDEVDVLNVDESQVSSDVFFLV